MPKPNDCRLFLMASSKTTQQIRRPSQVTGLFMAEIRWSDLMGGYTETIGPMSSTELNRQVRGLKAGLPGDHQPSVTIREVPRV